MQHARWTLILLILAAIAIQAFTSFQIAGAGWGSRKLKRCRTCGSAALYANGIVYNFQYIPIWRPVKSATTLSDPGCEHVWRWGRVVSTGRLSPVHVAIGKAQGPGSDFFAVLLLTSILFACIAFVLGMHEVFVALKEKR